MVPVTTTRLEVTDSRFRMEKVRAVVGLRTYPVTREKSELGNHRGAA